jgi:hypothetical protein
MIMRIILAAALILLAILPFSAADAQQRTMILIPGAGGPVPIDFLMRNRGRFAGAGFETRVATSAGSAVQAARNAKKRGRRVIIVGMSRGGNGAAGAIARGAPADGVVFVSAGLRRVANILGSPSRLPATLIVHHRYDECRLTSPRGVRFFRRWAGGKVRVRWIRTDGAFDRRPCGPRGAHGFFRKDGPAVSAIISFARSR